MSITSGGIFELDVKKSRIAELERLMEAQDFWDDREKARETIDEVNRNKEWVDGWAQVDAKLADLLELKQLADEEEDEDTLVEVDGELDPLQAEVESFELKHMLGDRVDRANAILTIHPGAGGTEAQDWAQMLMRMYNRWAERRGFKTDTLDLSPGDTAGIKSATIEIEGDYAYGYLKAEIGVHRLVRISPFDSNSRRHTSFASVFVYPESTGEIEIEIKPEDLRVDTYRAGGAGGQHVNKTDSAVRMTHIPTGVTVQCQNERSQHKNRNSAMKILKARLYQHYQDLENEKKAEVESGKKKIEWGSQIRNYVFQPHQMIKDVRTGLETSDIQGVMDGRIDDFIKAFLIEYSS